MTNSLAEAIRAAVLGEIRTVAPDTVEGEFRFPAGFPGFAGHFPGYPILPAVVQMLTALCLAEDWGGRPLRLLAVEHAKFMMPLGPQQKIVVQCRERRKADRRLLDARLCREEQLAASFTLVVVDREVEE